MIKLRTIIVDDEPLALCLLKMTLQNLESIELVAECQNGMEAIGAVVQHAPDLMFLDIQMPGMTGFEVVKALQADLMPMVVFSTAYQQYALDAFDCHAIDYILKPLSEDRVERAVLRAVERYQAQLALGENKSPLIDAIDSIANSLSSPGDTAQGDNRCNDESATLESIIGKIAIKDASTVKFVDENDIDWVDAAGDYMCIHVNGETHIMRSTMKELLNKLNTSIFKRVHRSTVVNVGKIEKITPHTKGEFFLHLMCGERLKVSRSYKESIRALL